MSVSKSYAPWSVVLDAQTAQAGTAVYVDAIQNLSLDPALQDAVLGGSGQPYNSMGFLRSGAPVASFDTFALKTFLDECGTEGMLVDSGVDGDGVDLWFHRYAKGGSRMTGANNWRCRVGDGLLIPSNIALSDQGDAMVSAQLTPISSDGITSPLAFTEAGTLPAEYPDTDAVWGLGPVDLNGVALEGIQSVNVNYGIQMLIRKADGNIYPTFIAIRLIQPRITIVTEHIDISTTLGEEGLEYPLDQVICYARKRDEGGKYVADGTAQHISWTMGICRLSMGAISNDPASTTVTITPWDSPGGSPTHPITQNTATAIT